MSAEGKPRPWSVSEYWTDEELKAANNLGVRNAEPLPEGAVEKIVIDEFGNRWPAIVIEGDLYDARLAPFVINDPTYPPAHESYFKFADDAA